MSETTEPKRKKQGRSFGWVGPLQEEEAVSHILKILNIALGEERGSPRFSELSEHLSYTFHSTILAFSSALKHRTYSPCLTTNVSGKEVLVFFLGLQELLYTDLKVHGGSAGVGVGERLEPAMVVHTFNHSTEAGGSLWM